MQTFFTEVFTPRMPAEQLETCREVIALFETVGFTAPFEPLQECMEIGTSQTDTDGFNAQARAVLNDGLDLLLKVFGVEVRESTTMEFKLQVATVIATLEDYYLPAELLDIVDGASDGVNVVAEILHVTAGISVEEALDTLYSVEPQFLKRLHSVLTEKLQYQDIETAIDTEATIDPARTLRIQLLNKLTRGTEAQATTIVNDLIQANASIGTLDPVAVINQYVDTLTLISPDKLASELFAIVVFSYTPKESWLATTRELALEFTDLLSDLRVIDRYLESQKGLL